MKFIKNGETMAEVQNYDEFDGSEGALLTPSEIEARAEASIDRVYAFLSDYGINPLEKRPRIKCLDVECPLNSRAIAAANIDVESMKELFSVVGVVLIRASYARFGLIVSDEAAREAIEVGNKELSEVIKLSSVFDDSDVTLFSPVRDALCDLDSIMGHEIWHLKEDELGLLKNNSLLREATATYVENLIVGRSSMNSQVLDHFDVVYKYGASIIEEEIGGMNNPLQALLDSAIRWKLEVKFQEKVMPLLEQKIGETFDPSESEALQVHILNTDPAYEVFREEPTAENFLESLRRKGYNKLADDFLKQDISKLVEYNKGFIPFAEKFITLPLKKRGSL